MVTAKLKHKPMKPALNPISGSFLVSPRDATIPTPVVSPAKTPAVVTRREYRPSTTPGKNCATPVYPMIRRATKLAELRMAKLIATAVSPRTVAFANLATCASVIEGARIGRQKFFMNRVAAVRICIDAGTIAVSAPAPPTIPKNQAGNVFRTMLKSARSPFGRFGKTRRAVKPTIRTRGIVML